MWGFAVKPQAWSGKVVGEKNWAFQMCDGITLLEGTMHNVFELSAPEEFFPVRMWTPQLDRLTQTRCAVLASLAFGDISSIKDVPFSWAVDGVPRIVRSSEDEWHLYMLDDGWACTRRINISGEVLIASGFQNPEDAYRLVLTQDESEVEQKLILVNLPVEFHNHGDFLLSIIYHARNSVDGLMNIWLARPYLSAIAQDALLFDNWYTLTELLERVMQVTHRHIKGHRP